MIAGWLLLLDDASRFESAVKPSPVKRNRVAGAVCGFESGGMYAEAPDCLQSTIAIFATREIGRSERAPMEKDACRGCLYQILPVTCCVLGGTYRQAVLFGLVVFSASDVKMYAKVRQVLGRGGEKNNVGVVGSLLRLDAYKSLILDYGHAPC